MKCIYWNTKNCKSLERVLDLLEYESPDLLFLSEIDELLLESEQGTLRNFNYEYFPNPGCNRVKIIKKMTTEISLSLQTNYYTTVKLEKDITYVVSVHLPSLMFQHFDSLKEFIRDFRTNIDAEIGSSLDERILIIGDFNVNPFEKPMIDFDGFLATNSVNSKAVITHLRKTKQLYYNPTWKLYNRTNFPGTKYFKRPSGSSYDILEFHYLDQVLLSQSLKEYIESEEIGVIEKTNGFSYFNQDKNLIEGSDHLPLFYEYKLKK